MDDDVISIIVEAKVEEAEKARQKLDQLGQQVKQLKGDLDAGRISQAGFASGFAVLDQQLLKTKGHLRDVEDQIRNVGGKLQGAGRASAKFQVGLAGANIIQDVAQGGPAAGINNLLGLAGSNGVRALGGEALAAAGGIAAIGTAFATVAVAAGAAYLVIDHGLKEAKLGWSDLGEVVSNTHAWEAAGEAIRGAGVYLKEGADSMAFQVALEDAKAIGPSLLPWIANLQVGVGLVDQYAIGWGQATEATREHNAELARSTKAAADYAEAVKGLGGVKNEAQQDSERKGKLVGQQVAELEPGGWKAVAAKLAQQQTAFTTKGPDGKVMGPEEKVKVQELVKGKDGKPDSYKEVEVTRREARKREITADIGSAAGGDTAALDRLKPSLKGAGYDLSGVEAAASGRDVKKEAEKAKKDLEKADEDEFDRRARSSRDKAAKEKKARAEDDTREKKEAAEHAAEANRYSSALDSGPLGRKAIAGTLRPEDVQARMKELGASEADVDRLSPTVTMKLHDDARAKLLKRAGADGTDVGTARGALLSDAAAKEGDEARQKADRVEAEAEKAKKGRVEAAEKVTAGTGLDERGQLAMMRSMLSGGSKDAMIGRVEVGLKRELMQRGQGGDDAAGAAKAKAEEWFAKIGDDAHARAMSPPEAAAHRGVDRIDVGDFARSVESSGVEQQKKMVDGINAMKDKLAEIVRLLPDINRIRAVLLIAVVAMQGPWGST